MTDPRTRALVSQRSKLFAVWIGLIFLTGAVRADTFYSAGSGDNTIVRFNGVGTSLGTFPTTNLTTPVAIAFDSNGVLYVSNDRFSSPSSIEKYAADGTDLGTFASANLTRTYGLAFDSSGNLYAANFGNSTIRKFSPTGADLGAFVSTGVSGPVGLAFDANGNLYVANYGNNTIGRFSPTGANLGTFANTGLSTPYALAFDASGNLFVTNVGNFTVRKFSPAGVDLGVFASMGLNGPTGLAFDGSGNLYVASEQGHDIHKFSPSGADLGVSATAASNSSLSGLAIRFDAGMLQFNAAAYTVNENSGNAAITVSRVGGSTGAASVSYATSDGDAIAGTDYSPASGTLTWADGDIADKTFQVPITNRNLTDGSTRTLIVSLGQPTGSGASLGTITQATLTISENATPIHPTITITSPPANITVDVGSTVPLSASVTDPSGILSRVQFYLNGQLYGQTSSAGPYVLNAVAPAPGVYQLKAVALDSLGGQSSSTRTITVAVPITSNPAPSADIITDANGRAFTAGSNLALSINAAPAVAGDTLSRVDVFADDQLVASFDGAGNPLHTADSSGSQPTRKDDATPFGNGTIFKANVPLPSGVSKLVNIVAVAVNSLGRSQVSQPITVQSVANAADQAPRVSIGGLKNGQKLRRGQKFTVPVSIVDPDAPTASAIGAAGQPVRRAFDTSAIIARVEYYLNEAKIKDSAEAPFSVDITPPAAGTYVVTVIATDGAGLATVSDPITVQTSDVPTVTLAATVNSITAGAGETGEFTLTRDGDVSQDLIVSYTVKGSAVGGKDYQALKGTKKMKAGKTSVKLKVVPIGFGAGPGVKRVVTLTLAPADTYNVGTDGKTKVKIFGQ